jgi:hypothetical protein
VQRFGPAYRYPQAGWIVLHIEGEPYERGYQHGRLLAPEIEAYLRCSAAMRSSTAPADGWANTRSLVNALFLRRYDREYLEEMKGIADGASAAGARFENRPIDLVDIVAVNAWPEIETLDPALEATPTGLEGLTFPHPQPRAMPGPQAMHCSAFAATGPATADGKIVFGHITMFGLYPSLFYNVWLDVKPARGHRVLMQSYPGGIQSGMDYYMNDVGLLVSETTINQTRFDIKGLSLASRIRQALQYADSIDKAVAILQADNNGLYTNEWLLADTKTNEIAMFELGTARTKLYRSSRQEWFGGTDGFYWGCNNTKDVDVRLETIPGVNAAPANMVWRPSERDKTWLRLYNQYKGKIDADFGKVAFTTPPIAAYHSLDAKFTTSDLAGELKTWALYGPPLGRSWQPTQEERKKYSEVRAMASNPWTVLTASVPPTVALAKGTPADLPDKLADKDSKLVRSTPPPLALEPAWHGTLLPKTDSDAWLAAAFAEYEKIVSQEKAQRAASSNGSQTAEELDRLAVELFAHRSSYLAGARASADVPLAGTKAQLMDDAWYRVAAGKGVLLLAQLRRTMGHARFEEFMESFGKSHGGKQVSASDFLAAAEKAGAKPLKGFFAAWVEKLGLASLELGETTVRTQGDKFWVDGIVRARDLPPGSVGEITVEMDKGEVTKRLALHEGANNFSLQTNKKPRRVYLDRYAWMAQAAGGPFTARSFLADLSQTLIVYGTADEEAANHEAAEDLQRAIVRAWSNFTVPVKSDTEVTENELRSNHVLLVGRPDSNRWVSRFAGALPITLGSRSFSVGAETFAHSGSAVIVAAANPLNPRYSIVVLAGLSASATLSMPEKLLGRDQSCGEVILLPHGGSLRHLVVQPKQLVRDLEPATDRAAAR